MSNKTTQLSFLSGLRWADGYIANDGELEYVLKLIKNLKPSSNLSTTHANSIEGSLNFLALTILRYSKTEWGNDYYQAVDSMHDICVWLDRYQKHHKLGRYFKL